MGRAASWGRTEEHVLREGGGYAERPRPDADLESQHMSELCSDHKCLLKIPSMPRRSRPITAASSSKSGGGEHFFKQMACWVFRPAIAYAFGIIDRCCYR